MNTAASFSPNTSLGVLLNVLGSIMFAVMFSYTALLTPLDGEEIYGWRILLTLPCLTLLLLYNRAWPQVVDIIRRVRYERWFLAKRIISSSLVGFQLWLFMWAPVKGYGLDVSRGYFLLPISLVVVGRIAFKDAISKFQLWACILACVGVANQIWMANALSWPTLAICLGYPGYFWLRRVTKTDNLGGLWFDMSLSLPVSVFFVQGGALLTGMQPDWALVGLVLGLGAISAAALGLQSLSSPHLNLTLFGLLIYVEPVFLMLAAWLLGDTLEPGEWPTYIAIWLAVMLLVAEGVISLQRKQRKQRA
jgi:chloramphenicol-sensitive protein RarD